MLFDSAGTVILCDLDHFGCNIDWIESLITFGMLTMSLELLILYSCLFFGLDINGFQSQLTIIC